MKHLSWNCRGLGNQTTVRALKKILHTEAPECVFLMETRLTSQQMIQLNQVHLKFYGCFPVDCIGQGRKRSGGLCFLWKSEIEFNLSSFSNNHIMGSIRLKNDLTEWFLSGVYGWPENDNKWKTWKLMDRLRKENNEPWLCYGDFNEILWSAEKHGGLPKSYAAMDAFHQAIQRCSLYDLKHVGMPFTWSNGRTGRDNIQERLDRALANEEWRNIFPYYQVRHLGRICSDHAPIVISFDIEQQEEEFEKRKKRCFRFEKMWIQHPQFKDFLEKAWHEATLGYEFVEKIKVCGEMLMAWDRTHFGHVGKKIRELKDKLENLQKMSQSVQVVNEARTVEDELNHCLKLEETMWYQRSRVLWLKDGDRNSSFFHKKASQRKKRNTIRRIMNEDGIWVNKQKDIEKVIMNYFQELFKSQGSHGIEAVVSDVDTRVTKQMNDNLTRPFTKDEIEKALQQMHPSKAPGPDGMNPLFYQKYWNIVSDDTIKVVLDILNNELDPTPLNQTHIVLIPKVPKPESPKDLRPISLCNVVFRIITKVMANRLKIILPDVISNNQSAFIPGRFITDNAMTAFELFHSMKKKTKGKNGVLALKLDMSKAYDRVEWPFLEAIMNKMGFCNAWINLVMRCVTTVSYSIILNGSPLNFFSPGRGLRQGDPLSPYLFIICAEALSSLFRKAEQQNQIHGFKVNRHAPAVSHLFFADDSIIFCQANEEEAETVKEILHRYEQASGQKINLEKSEMTVSKNVGDQAKARISHCLGVSEVEYHKKYLGLPTLIGRSKKKVFESILQRVQNKLKDWKEQTLSRAGKEVLLKAVIQAIPTYSMSCFLLPVTLCDEIEKSIARFFWGSKDQDRKIHWNSWSALTTSKKNGGLGFREIRCFNLAMLAKQLWNIMHKPNAMSSQVLKAKYYPQGEVLDASLGHQPSFLWRSLLAARDLVKTGLAWRVGNGRRIRIRGENWIGHPHPLAPGITHDNLAQVEFVADLIDPLTHSWKKEVIDVFFEKEDANKIYSIPLSARMPEDIIIWGPEKKGKFTVKSAYHLAVSMFSELQQNRASPSDPERDWNKLWQSGATPKISHFMWRACVDSLPTLDNLCHRGLVDDAVCLLCGLGVETLNHLMMQCLTVEKIWKFGPLRLDFSSFNGASFRQVTWNLIDKFPREVFTLFECTAWSIWKARNSFLFEQKDFSHMDILNNAQKLWLELEETKTMTVTKLSCLTRQQKWKPPPAGTLNMDSDVAVFPTGRIGLGVVFRDELGKVVYACRTEINAAGSTTILEGLAIRFGLQKALQQEFSKLHVQSDNQSLISGIRGESEMEPYGQLLRDDILDFAKKVNVLSFNYIPRTCNRVAHMLARDSNFTVGNQLPSAIMNIVMSEAS